MSTIKNGQIAPCHFNKFIKGPGTNFQSPPLNQKHARNVHQRAHQYLTKFHFIVLKIQKNNFHYVAMSMKMSQILKSVDVTKTQKSRYLKNKTLFFLLIKNFINTHQGLLYCKNQFCSRGNFETTLLFESYCRVVYQTHL